jgi:ATP-dependent 26S proteasome regulatory subunit
VSIAEAKQALQHMATPEFNADMQALIRSRTPLIYLVSTEESRILAYFKHFSQAGSYRVLFWDMFSGLLNITNRKPAGLVSGNSNDPVAVLDWIIKEATDEKAQKELERNSSESPSKPQYKATIYIMLDFHRFLRPCTPEVERRLRTFHRLGANTSIILVGPHFESTAALQKCINVIDFPFPNRNELSELLDSIVASAREQCPNIQQSTEKIKETVLDSVSGLTMAEAEGAFAKSIVIHRALDIPSLLKQKQQIIRKTGVLEFYTPDVGMKDIGGLGNLRQWLKRRHSAFSPEARKYGIAMPKGILLIGVPGAGKSLSAKATATEYDMPLLRLDFGSLFNSLVGESERTARDALKIAEALAPCILWCDEIEKGLAGHKSSGQTDSGVTSRVIGTFLTWMQEKKSEVFIICTANQPESLPTEFLRAGRFDEIFFVDLPSPTERVEIFQALLRRKKRDPQNFDLAHLSSLSDGHTGAEIEKAIELAMLEGFHDSQREFTTEDIVEAFQRFKPLSKTKPEIIEQMQVWSKERCIRANTLDIIPGSLPDSPKIMELPNE